MTRNELHAMLQANNPAVLVLTPSERYSLPPEMLVKLDEHQRGLLTIKELAEWMESTTAIAELERGVGR